MHSSNKSLTIQLYEHYYINRDYEQIDLFRLLKNAFNIKRVIYPGSYVQISPAFIFSDVVFIDADKKAKKFFKSESVVNYIYKRKEYNEDPIIEFYGDDYENTIEGLRDKFDLLISQYAGFISDTCKDYLKIGGYLLVNNSHGDAGMASIDEDYKLTATVHKSKGKYRVSDANLKKYFVPKKSVVVTEDLLRGTGKGVGYRKTATLYIFQRVS